MNQISKVLKTKRIKLKLKQRDIANTLGYTSPQFISNWERGISTPPVKSLGKISSIYKIDKKYLYNLMIKKYQNELKKALEL